MMSSIVGVPLFCDLFKEHDIIDQVMQYLPEVDESGSVFHCGREEALIYQVLDQGIEDYH